MAIPSDIKTRLTSEWATTVDADAIALPSIEEGFLGEIHHDGNTILIGWGQVGLESADLGVANDQMNNLFEVVIISDHNVEATAKTNLIKMLSQVRRHINRTITNGEWHLDIAIPNKNGHEQLFICSLRQTLYYVGD